MFEDRASAFALFRDLPVPAFRLIDTDHHLEIVTDRVHLVYDRGPFSTSGLSIQVRGNISSYHSIWRFGETPDDLRGTARTLDTADGAVPLEPGVVSGWGFAVLDDSRTLLLTTTAGSPPATAPGPTSTSSATAWITGTRSRRSTRSPGRPRCCPGSRWATGGAATTGTPPTNTSS